MHGLGKMIGWILTAIFGEENAPAALFLLLIALVLVYIGYTIHEHSIYESRAKDQATPEGFRRFREAYAKEKKEEREARRREREARREARRREKEK